MPLVSQSQLFLLYSSFSALHKHFSLYAIYNLIKQNVQFAALCPLLPGLHGAGEVGLDFLSDMGQAVGKTDSCVSLKHPVVPKPSYLPSPVRLSLGPSPSLPLNSS